jgi:ABC-2 type transport system permease protein
VLGLSAILGVTFDWNPLHLVAAVIVVVIGSAFFSALSITIAGLVLTLG